MAELHSKSNEYVYLLELDFIYKSIVNLGDSVFRNKEDIIKFTNEQLEFYFRKDIKRMKLKISDTNLYLKDNKLDIELFNKLFHDNKTVMSCNIINNFNVEPIFIIKKLILK